jgi:hypothetical protein
MDMTTTENYSKKFSCFVNISKFTPSIGLCQGMLTGLDGVELEVDDCEKLVINTMGRVKVVSAIAVPKISMMICVGGFFFLEGSPASIYLRLE